MNKLKKTASTLDNFFYIGYCVTLGINILCLILVVLWFLAFLGAPEMMDQLSASYLRNLSFGGISFQLAPEVVAAAPQVGGLWLGGNLMLGMLELLVYVLMIRAIRGILAPMKEGLPFAREVSVNFKRLGRLTLADGILTIASNEILRMPVQRAYDLDALFLSDKITNVTTSNILSFNFLILALALFGLSYVFRYGQELQQLSDETL